MKKIGLFTTLLVAGLLLTGCLNKIQYCLSGEAACTKIINNCGDDCINESDIDVLEHKCMEYVNNTMFYNIEVSASRTNHYFYDNSGSMEYTFTDAEFLGTYYGIKGYVKAGDISSNFICNIYTGGGLHNLHFYNDKPNNEEPTYEILEWTGYMGCIGGCEDGNDEEYVEGYYYRYTNPELGLRITTPSGDGGNYNEGFRIKIETPIFKQVDNVIYSLEYDYVSNWSISDAEFIKVYEKDKNISLENLLEQKYEGCIVEQVDIEQAFGDSNRFYGFDRFYYYITRNGSTDINNCTARDDGEGEGPIIIFLESLNRTKYYKVGMGDACAPGPCSIFGKIEIL